ncbi:response regulator transcription factor [Siphonobacter curvatus]|nr:response regulator transcription factor [Siphonobacter curvatus]
MMFSILIADDHSIVRHGVQHLLKSFLPSVVISEAETFKKALSLLEQQRFDLAILDIHIPGGDNVAMISKLQAKQADLKVLIFSSYEERLYAMTFMQAGADGYLSKDASNQEFERAVKTILANHKYVSQHVKEESLHQVMSSGGTYTPAIQSLSKREREIAQLLLTGKSTSEIAILLNVHISTVSTHKSNLFEKLHIQNMLQLSSLFKVNQRDESE